MPYEKFEKKVSVLSPINIAIIKYWGKKCDPILPANSSISLTLDPNKLHSASIICVSTDFNESEVILNNLKCSVSQRMKDMFKYALEKSTLDDDIKFKLKFSISSSNNFPTAAGLASSASGMSAFAYGLGKLLNLDEQTIAIVARLGSGSATRSVFGGIVEWPVGDLDTSYGTQLYNEDYWPELKVYVCIINSTSKAIGSTIGMKKSMTTSLLLPHRINVSLPFKIKELKECLASKDFERLAEIIMKESNQLHAICMDTYPPIRYLSDKSFTIIEFVHKINEYFKKSILAYTFDAGPNAFLIFEKENEALIQKSLQFSFDVDFNDSEITSTKLSEDLKEFELDKLNEILPKHNDVIQKIIQTQIGSGPIDCTDKLKEYAQYFKSLKE